MPNHEKTSATTTDQSIPAGMVEVRVISQADAQKMVNTALSVRLSDSDGDNKLSRAEFTQSAPLKLMAITALTEEATARSVTIDYPMPIMGKDGSAVKNFTTTNVKSFVIADRPLLQDVPLMEAVTGDFLGQITKPAPFKLPKGAEKVMLSDFCGPGSELPCQILPKVKGDTGVRIMVGPKGKTI